MNNLSTLITSTSCSVYHVDLTWIFAFDHSLDDMDMLSKTNPDTFHKSKSNGILPGEKQRACNLRWD